MPRKIELTVAIVGAGLAGLALAVALQSHGIDCTVYEAALSPEQVVKGSLNIAPNGQAALASLDLLPQLRIWGIMLQEATVHDSQGKTLGKLLLGSEKYFGYDALRLVRAKLIDELARAAEERGVAVKCNKKFVRIVSESREEGVTIEFEDGTTSTTALVLAADGIHSRIRQSLFPEVKTNYIGTTVVSASVAWSAAPGLSLDNYGMYVNAGVGSAMLGPHTPTADDWLVAFQSPYPELGKEGSKAMQADTSRLRAYLETGKDQWHQHVQDAIAAARDDTLFLWQMHTLPELSTWLSPSKRIVLVGDAAHAMPPTAGQGANQAFEDARTLSLVLAAVQQKGKDLDSALEFWQKLRHERVKQVVDLAMQWNKMRQPDKAGVSSNDGTLGHAEAESERINQMQWLYGGIPVQEHKIEEWSQHQSS